MQRGRESKTGSSSSGQNKFGELHVILLVGVWSVGGYGDSYGGRRLRMQRHPHFLGDVFVIGFARG
jgi:hypothetical protein